jgi:hypothetical protein
MATVLDTHRAVKDLVGAGASEPLAEAVTRLVKEHGDAGREQAATKDDLADTELRLGNETKQVELRLAYEIKQAELRLGKEMTELKAHLLKWLVPLLAGQILVQLGVLAKLVWP